MVITFQASVLSVGHEARGTELADGFVLLDVAGGVRGTGRLGARVDAPVVTAGELGRAAAVAQADGQRRIAVANADADGLVIEYLAALVLSTGRYGACCAWILAFAVDAGRVGRAVNVAPAGRRVRSAGQLAELV